MGRWHSCHAKQWLFAVCETVVCGRWLKDGTLVWLATAAWPQAGGSQKWPGPSFVAATGFMHQLLQMDAAKINWPAFSSVQNKKQKTKKQWIGILFFFFSISVIKNWKKAFLYNVTFVLWSCHLFCLEPKIQWKRHSGRTSLTHASGMCVPTTNNNDACRSWVATVKGKCRWGGVHLSLHS